MRSVAQTMTSQWYTMISGLLLTLTAGALVFALVPMSYTSSGTVVVMPPKHPTARAGNPLLAFNSNLDTIALILLQVMSSPLLPARIGLVDGHDTVAVKNAGISSAPDASAPHPFISISAQSPDATRSPAIVSWVIDLVRSDLAAQQRALNVPKRAAVTLESVVAPTPAKPVWTAPVGASGGALLLGLVLTTIVARGIDRAATRRQQHEFTPAVPLDGPGYPPIAQKPVPTAPAARPAVAALATGIHLHAG